MNFIDKCGYFDQNNMKPLDACNAVGQMPNFKEPKIIGDYVVWLEQRPNERGRTTALIRPWMQKNLEPQELTPHPINLKTRVHGYGGGPIALSKKENLIFLCWIDDFDGCLWMQS